MLYTYPAAPAPAMEWVSVPEVEGMSIVEAGRQIRARGLEMMLEGSGLAIGQQTAAGTFVAPGTIVKVNFEIPQ